MTGYLSYCCLISLPANVSHRTTQPDNVRSAPFSHLSDITCVPHNRDIQLILANKKPRGLIIMKNRSLLGFLDFIRLHWLLYPVFSTDLFKCLLDMVKKRDIVKEIKIVNTV